MSYSHLATMNFGPAPFISSPASFRFFTICPRVLRTEVRRHQSSYRRTRSRLNVKPDASFLPTKTQTHDHIIFNPPPSAPNVYHTPSIFLPKTDPRRQLHRQMSTGQITQPEATTEGQQAQLPPPLPRQYEKKYHLTQDQIIEMRTLREEDPVKWSVQQLVKKYDCSPVFVQMMTGGSKQSQERQKAITDAVKSRWGKKRRMAREDRALRKERWFRDA